MLGVDKGALPWADVAVRTSGKLSVHSEDHWYFQRPVGTLGG